MTLPLTWDQMPLTPAQQAAIQNLIAWSVAGDGTQPPMTYSQTKNFRAWLVSLANLAQPGRTAVQQAIDYYQTQAVANFDQANP